MYNKWRNRKPSSYGPMDFFRTRSDGEFLHERTINKAKRFKWFKHLWFKGTVSSSFMEHFISRQTTTNLWFFSTSGIGNALNYINLMHQIRRIITEAQLHVCQRLLLDVRGIVRVVEVFVQLLGLKLAL